MDPDSKEKATTWEKPAGLAWTELKDGQGRPYFHNSKTETTSWDRPIALAWKQVPTESAKEL